MTGRMIHKNCRRICKETSTTFISVSEMDGTREKHCSMRSPSFEDNPFAPKKR